VVAINFLVLVAVLVLAYPRARPAIQIPTHNRNRFANVVILIDPTRSMRDNDLALAKTIAKDTLISSIGYGDLLTVCHIGPIFRPENCFKSMKAATQDIGVSPEHALAIVEEHRTRNGVGRQNFYELLRRTRGLDAEVQDSQKRWMEVIDAIQRPSAPGSDFCGALNVVEQVFATNLKARGPSDKMLYVIGDLVQDEPQRCVDANSQATWFAGVNVTLIYPLNSTLDWQRIMSFWSQYFGGKKFHKVPFQAALSGNGYVLPPNPLQSFPKHVPTYWDSVRGEFALLRYSLSASLVGFILIGGLGIARSRKEE